MDNSMGTKDFLYYCFYTICFAMAMWSGFKTGFTGSHVPPLPFMVEFFALPIGFVLMMVDIVRLRPVTFQNMRVHIIGFGTNSLVMIYILILAFK